MDGQFLEHLGESQKDRLLFQGAHKLFGMLIHIVALEFAPDCLKGMDGTSHYLQVLCWDNVCFLLLLPWRLLQSTHYL